MKENLIRLNERRDETLEIQNMSKVFRNAILTAANDYGGSIRQLSRQTGLSYGLIRKVS